MSGLPTAAGAVVMASPMQQGMALGGTNPGIMQGVQMGMPAGAQMGMPVRSAAPAVPATFECRVQVPKALVPGDTFMASTPDGQEIEVTVPPGTEPGASISFSYNHAPSPSPTVVGMPIGMQMHGLPGVHPGLRVLDPALHGLHGLPPLAALEYASVLEGENERQDRKHSEIGWVLYCMGWALCCCCGPIGPVFWFAIACMHWCRPATERERLPREHAMATVSLWTGAFGVTMSLLLFLAVASNTINMHHRNYAGGNHDGSDQDQHHHRMRGYR